MGLGLCSSVHLYLALCGSMWLYVAQWVLGALGE